MAFSYALPLPGRRQNPALPELAGVYIFFRNLAADLISTETTKTAAEAATLLLLSLGGLSLFLGLSAL